MIDKDVLSKACTGLGVGLLVFLYWLTRSRDFEQGMLALSSEQSDNATMVMVGGLVLAVVLLVVGRRLGQSEPKA